MAMSTGILAHHTYEVTDRSLRENIDLRFTFARSFVNRYRVVQINLGPAIREKLCSYLLLTDK